MSQLSTFFPTVTATSLGLGNSANVTFGSVTAGSIQNTPIGSTTRNTGAFTTLNANNGTITASAPVLDLEQTWNNINVTFTGMRLNCVQTANNVASSYFTISRTGTPVFQIVAQSPNIPRIELGTGGFITNMRGRTASGVGINFDGIVGVNTSLQFGVGTTTGSGDVVLVRDSAADTLALQRSTNPQTFRLYNTFTDASNYERGFMRWSSNVLQIGTEAGGTGSARNLEFQTGGTTRLTLNTAGSAIFGGIIATNASVQLSSNFTMGAQSAASTLNCISNPAAIRLFGLGADAGTGSTNTERLHISTRTGASYFISTQATGTGTARALELRTNDVARLTIEAAGGLTVADANNIALGTTTGTKIGTATTQKLGFFNATPVDQPNTVADPTGGGTIDTEARTAINDIIDRLQELGLIA